MKKLTVMVSAYQSGDWIENRLNNLRDITSPRDIAVWVINTNSPDERDDSIPRKFPVNYIKLPERTNVYAAWNHIIQNSNSQYLTNANADDLIAPNGYEKLMKVLDTKKNIGFVYPSWYTTSTPNLGWNELNATNTDKSGMPGYYAGDLNNGGVGHFPMWRRDLHTKFGLFDETFQAIGDADWWARCYFVGKTGFMWKREYLACYLWRNHQNLWHRTINAAEWDKYHNKVAAYKAG